MTVGLLQGDVLTDQRRYRVFVKAYRLRHFGRCPVCDVAGVEQRPCADPLTDEYSCAACGWKALVATADLIATGDTNIALYLAELTEAR